ncbi:DUF3566 domain-containing protein [Marisediminicola antarctica]|uniref:DUF3566 domain-containing protein n=1 Tax=Marisediminicola antarctica TaxID=674079 RepID=A0A7L5AHK6_9MICO|nr:DUF3566 domain-containing protein [Marisediminicola antarctica]QHO68561.1 hypothetical protein BHD05_01875 [Marisediminicola antarctica]
MSSVAEKLQRKAPKKANTKQVRLKLMYLDFWSVVKLSFLTAICFGIVQVVVAILVWTVLNSTGIFSELDDLFRAVLNDETFSVTSEFSLATVASFALVVAALNVVIGTALGAVFAVLYNLAARITGGLLVGFQNN